ncbi:MAG: hypothetical protein K2X03_21175 [Bryobacteraceae bacterium]|nr:hypothetical protein [Bryobacteraceae bacterium]
MSIPLRPRVPFGPADDPASQAPWPPNGIAPSTFSLEWLEKTFLHQQETRLREVNAAIADGTKRIEALRAEAAPSLIEIGQRQANGTVLRTAAEQRLQQEVASHAQKQVVHRIIGVRKELDSVVPPIINTMHRAAHSARTLSARVFDKISCLSRFSAGLKYADLAALKASYATFLRGMAAIELNRLAQNAIDDGSVQSIVLLDCIRVENFGRKHKEDRAFENAALLQLIRVTEHDQAQPLLQQVIDHYNIAYAAWADFSGKTNRATTLRIGHALGKLSLPVEVEE